MSPELFASRLGAIGYRVRVGDQVVTVEQTHPAGLAIAVDMHKQIRELCPGAYVTCEVEESFVDDRATTRARVAISGPRGARVVGGDRPQHGTASARVSA